MVKTVVKSKHLLAFKFWFLKMNYVVNDLADGGFTAKIKAKEFKKGHPGLRRATGICPIP